MEIPRWPANWIAYGTVVWEQQGLVQQMARQVLAMRTMKKTRMQLSQSLSPPILTFRGQVTGAVIH